jgi:hypothetical protein
MGLLFDEEPDPPRRKRRSVLFPEVDEETAEMPRRRYKRGSRCKADNDPANIVVEAIFESLQWAWAHKDKRSERESWRRLMAWLKQLPAPECDCRLG